MSAILIAGDSIAATYPAEHIPMTGWGQVLGELAHPEIRIVNFASPGRSTKSFRTQGRWDALLEALRKDDFVLIQFGKRIFRMITRMKAPIARI